MSMQVHANIRTDGTDGTDVVASDTPSASQRRRPRRTNGPGWRIQAIRLAILVGVVGLWEYAAGRWVDDFFTSRPSEIADAWWAMASSGELWFNAQSTFYSFGIGFSIGAVFAISIGYALGGSHRLSQIFEPFITGIYSVPKLALVPLFVMWFGVGRQLQVVICALVVFFLMFFNTFYGIRDVDRSLIDAVKVMGGRRRDLALKVRLPSALVWVVAGLKLSVPQGLIAVVVAEILASNRGLGHMVSVNAGQFHSAGTFAAILTLLMVGLALDRVVALLTRRALIWKEGLTH